MHSNENRAPPNVLNLELRCPRCSGGLERREPGYCCVTCALDFPIIGQAVPVLIDPENSIFRPESFVNGSRTYFAASSQRASRLARLIPSPSLKPKTKSNLRALRKLLLEKRSPARVLVVGAGFGGLGIEILTAPSIEIVLTDVAAVASVDVICDAHCLPFADTYFDAVVIQDVLQHVIDPVRCVSEVHRVLKQGGLLYVEAAFVQQICGGRYDFQRFTHLGLLRLLSNFRELSSGAAAGPATVMLWSYENLLHALLRNRSLRVPVKIFARVTGYPLKLIDHLVIDTPEALDGASAVYFLGEKADSAIPSRLVPDLYRGAW